MASSGDLTNLLGILKRLYLRIMALQASSHTGYSHHARASKPHNIAKPLSDCIDKLAASAVNKPSTTIEPHIHELGFSAHTHTTTITRDPDSWTELGELSLHLKDSHKYTGTSQDTGTRLVQSTWEHFHSTIRLARQGNAKAARVHMELTNSALAEAAHYLTPSEYDSFSREVMQALEEITNQTE